MDCLNGTTFAGMVTLPYKIKKILCLSYHPLVILFGQVEPRCMISVGKISS
jgi:hypothetical protein